MTRSRPRFPERRPPLARRARGVTLVEVLVTAVVCGAGLAVIASAISTSIRAEGRAEGVGKATRLLALQLGRLEGGVIAPQDTSGTFSDEGDDDISWSLVTTPSDVANLLQCTLTVTWDEHGETRDLSLVRLLYLDPAATSANSLGGQAAGMGSSSGSGSSAKTSTSSASGSSAKTSSGSGSSSGRGGP